MNRSWILPVGIITIIAILGICCLCLVIGFGAWSIFSVQRGFSIETPFFGLSTPTETPEVIRPTQRATDEAPAQATAPEPGEATASPGLTPAPAGPGSPDEAPTVSSETLNLLEQTIVPISDLIDLSRRLEGKTDIPTTVSPPPGPLAVGTQQPFWVTNTDTNENFQIDATLQYVTDHVYFWVQDSVRFDEGELSTLTETFERQIYPTDREFFGSEWTPGVDGDPHLYILYARGLGGSVAGYYSSVDEYPPQANEYSNAHEMFLLSADFVDLGEDFAYSVLAHEFQHMIHWYRDRNEDTWMNEGFSELASFLNGYEVGGTDFVYTLDPDIQLNDWPSGDEDKSPHYGASFLFLAYFLDRFGEDATKAVVANPENGLVSIDDLLAETEAVHPDTGQPATADDVFADWAVASYLQDGNAGDGRFTYHNYPGAPQPSETESIQSCPADLRTRDVSQYGVDYIRINCSGDFTLNFEGSVQVGVVPTDPYSGSYSFWSNKGDESDMTLTQTFDFTGQTGPLTLSYWTWYHLEEDYDYLYLEASLDGENWQILETPSGTAEDPSGNSYGWGYNGKSGGAGNAVWIQESVDISQFAGQQVQLRFEYITDAAVNGEGLLVDDISIPEIGYFSDFEADDGGWQANGFVRIQNILPQTFRISVISHGQTTNVEQYTVSGDNAVQIPLQMRGDVDEVTLVVSGTTRFTRQRVAYRFSIDG